MVWQPTAHIWAADTIKIDERELEEPMEGVEITGLVGSGPSGSGSAKGDN